MIDKFVQKWEKNKHLLQAKYSEQHPGGYDNIVADLVDILKDVEELDFDCPDKDRITIIDHGHYQGTRLYVIGGNGYDPKKYWTVFVNYGSCSGCDTYENIRSYSHEKPNKQQTEDYMTLALHILQSMKEIE